MWSKVRQNYYDDGIKIFWLDEAEPEYTHYHYDIYRYHLGPDVQIGNIYPVVYARAFFEGMSAAGQENVINLLRCAWAGSQSYGALVWSGDIDTTFRSMRNQFAAGLNMGIAGIPWWTTDIGGFHGGNPDDPAYREVLARWFQWGAFCPVFRLHGFRDPHKAPLSSHGGGKMLSGAANEVWSYGDEVYAICTKYMALRERMKPYITGVMAGRPRARHARDAHPVLRIPGRRQELGRERPVPVRARPAGRPGHGCRRDGSARSISRPAPSGPTPGPAKSCPAARPSPAAAPLDTIPLFLRNGAALPIK